MLAVKLVICCGLTTCLLNEYDDDDDDDEKSMGHASPAVCSFPLFGKVVYVSRLLEELSCMFCFVYIGYATS